MSQDQAVPVTEPIRWAGVVQAVDQFMAFWGQHQLAPPPEIRLTRQQLDTVREVLPDVKPEDFSCVRMFGVPVVLVDDVEDSTPFQRYHERQLGAIRRIAHDPGA